MRLMYTYRDREIKRLGYRDESVLSGNCLGLSGDNLATVTVRFVSWFRSPLLNIRMNLLHPLFVKWNLFDRWSFQIIQLSVHKALLIDLPVFAHAFVIFFHLVTNDGYVVDHYHDSCSCCHFCSSSLPIMTFIARVLWPVFVVLSLLLLSS